VFSLVEWAGGLDGMIDTRKINQEDLDLICQHRVAMFTDGGRRTEHELTAMDTSFRKWLEPRLKDETYFGFISSDDQTPIAGVGLMELDWPPHPSHPEDGRRGYVLNLFVDPKYRKQGIAKNLMRLADNEFKERDIQYAILHSTSAARPVYEQIGWRPTAEMAKLYRK
jgi:ribosomal protein S18 acetylase RimI-like enzyme